MTTQEAIHDALGRCIRRNVFTEFLVECGQEIEPILAEALDQSCALDQVREEAREEAATRGYTEAQAQAYEAGYMGRLSEKSYVQSLRHNILRFIQFLDAIYRGLFNLHWTFRTTCGGDG